jgi:hypothetical protein
MRVEEAADSGWPADGQWELAREEGLTGVTPFLDVVGLPGGAVTQKEGEKDPVAINTSPHKGEGIYKIFEDIISGRDRYVEFRESTQVSFFDAKTPCGDGTHDTLSAPIQATQEVDLDGNLPGKGIAGEGTAIGGLKWGPSKPRTTSLRHGDGVVGLRGSDAGGKRGDSVGVRKRGPNRIGRPYPFSCRQRKVINRVGESGMVLR